MRLYQSKKNKKKWLLLFLTFVGTTAGAEPIVIPEVKLQQQTTIIKADARIQTTHLTRQDIKQSPVPDLSQLFQREQSIIRLTNNSSDSSQTALSIRGFGDNAAANSLILIDGFPLENPSLLAPNFNSIALTDIERIDIMQGSQGTLWGNQAVGGVVNIITCHPEKFMLDVNLGAGSFNQRFYNLFLGTKFNNGIFFKGFDFSNDNNQYREHNHLNEDSLFFQAGVDYARGTLLINLQQYNNTTGFPGGLSFSQFKQHPWQATNFINFANYQTQNIQLFNQFAFNDNWILETRISNRQLNGDGFIFIPYNRVERMRFFHPRLLGKIYQNKITLGYDLDQDFYQLNNIRVHDAVTTTQNSFYLQDITPLTQQLDLTLGARFAAQNDSIKIITQTPTHSHEQIFVTEQGLAFHWNPEWQFFLRRDGNFSFPKANEQTWIPPTVSSLNPQTGVSYEAGSIWTTQRQVAQINVYQLQLKNEIAFDPTPTLSDPFGTFQNFKNTLRRGITLTERYQLTPKTCFNAQFNYVDARFTSGPFSGKFIPAVSAINSNLGITYLFTPHWQGQYDALYTGSRYPSNDLNNIGKKLPGYWLNSVAIQYMLNALIASVSVANLFNQSYSTYTLFDPETGTNTFYPGTGRSFLVTIKANVS